MLNIPKISGLILNKKTCPLCKNKLVEHSMTGERYTCKVVCNTCKLSFEGYHFYDCYDALINYIINVLRRTSGKVKKHISK